MIFATLVLTVLLYKRGKAGTQDDDISIRLIILIFRHAFSLDGLTRNYKIII